MSKKIVITGFLVASMFLCACTTTNPRYLQVTAEMGSSYEIVRFNQIINPEAGLSGMPVEGIDGQVGADTYKNYQDGFKVKAPPSPVFNLNMGS